MTNIKAYVYGSFLCAKNCSKDFACIISFNSPNLTCCLKAHTGHTRKYFPDLSSL